MESIIQELINYIIKVGITTFNQLFILLGPVLILALIMYYVSKFVQFKISDVLGPRVYIYGFKILGTPVHEIGHALFAILFGHRIIEIELFKPDPVSGSIGYVYHSWDKDNIYQSIGNFFIGIGPVVLGSIVIFLSTHFLLGPAVLEPINAIEVNSDTFSSLGNFWAFLQQTYPITRTLLSSLFTLENLANWKFYIFLYIAISIGTSITLSPSDIHGAALGFGALIAIIFAFNLFTLWLGDFAQEYIISISELYGFFYAIMIFVLVLELLLAAVLLIPYLLKRV
jgi:hypothetical protein